MLCYATIENVKFFVMDLSYIYCFHPITFQQSRQDTFRIWGQATPTVYTPQLKCFVMQKDPQIFLWWSSVMFTVYTPSHYINQIGNVQKLGLRYFYSLHPTTKMLCYAKKTNKTNYNLNFCDGAKRYLLFTPHRITAVKTGNVQNMGQGYCYSLHPTTKMLRHAKRHTISIFCDGAKWYLLFTPHHITSIR